jgi:N-acetylmuramoyl-L-alanine amidase
MNQRFAAVGLIVIWAAVGLEFARDRQAAREYFEKARSQYDLLLQQKESARTVAGYNKVITLFRRVIDKDPSFGAADDSLFFIASLYDEMGRRFDSDVYRRRAVYYYEFVAREYPTTRYKKTAQARAQVVRAVLGPPVSAPVVAARAAAPQRASATPEADPPSGVSENVNKAPAPRADQPATVESIRYWSNEDYTRVVIQLDREVEVKKEALTSPARLYLDLYDARLKSSRLARTYDVNDLFIQKIRVAENRPGVVRVVLDYEDINTYTILVLYDPFRLVIDTRGERRPSLAAGKPAPQKMQTAEAVIPLDPNSPEKKKETRAQTPVLPSPARRGDMSLTRVLGLKIGRVVIDPGHGGKDTGSIGPTGLKEKDLVLDVSLRLKSLLEQRLGTDVVLTRTGDDFVPLEERTAIANQQNADLFISVHANSSRIRRVSGAETFFLSFATSQDEREVASRENAASQRNIHELEDLLRQIALGDYHAESRQLAGLVQTNLWNQMKPFRPKQKNRGVKKAPFIVLIGANMPSILTEIGFISNSSDEKYLKLSKSRVDVAEALYKGVEDYFRALGAEPVAAAASGR